MIVLAPCEVRSYSLRARYARCHTFRAGIPLPRPLAAGCGLLRSILPSCRRRSTKIHCLVRWANWTVIERAEDRITLGYLLHPQTGYPFLLALEVEYALSDMGLRVRTTARNVGKAPAPFGAGNHPYFTVGTEFADAARLHVPAETYYLTNERSIPIDRASVAGTELDFRTEHPIGPLHIDTGYTD